MITKTFHGGVHPPECKEFTVDKKLKVIPAPSEVVLPLSQHQGAANEPLVKPGESVKVGQPIGEAKAFVSAPVHSPVSGMVKSVQTFLNPIYEKSPAVVIENDGRDQSLPLKKRENPETLSNEELIKIIKESGIVGLGGAAFPTHVKLDIPKEKKIDTLIVNGAECEPYLTCDHRLMAEKTDEILKGIYLVAKILEVNPVRDIRGTTRRSKISNGVKNIFLAIEENKLSAIFAMEKAVGEMVKKFSYPPIRVTVLKTKYPQGGEKQLIKALLGREVPPEKLPLDVNVVVQNVGTCFAIYEAVYHRKPLIDRCVTLTGSSLKEPGNFVVRLGTLLKDAVELCGGFVEFPAKIIAGGPMMGITQYSLDIPITKGVTGVVFLSKKDVELFEESPCIRCAKCVDICPVNLMPTDIMRMVKYSRWHYLNELHASDCIECGACAYACPSKIPLVQYIKLAKMKELERK